MRPHLSFNRRTFRNAGVAVLVIDLVGRGAGTGADVRTTVTTKTANTKNVTVYAATTRSRQAPGKTIGVLPVASPFRPASHEINPQ